MGQWQRWTDGIARRHRLVTWRREGALDASTFERARQLLGPVPDATQWRRFLDQLGLWLGVVLLGAGAICLIAANWEQLGKFARLYGMQAVLVGAVVAAAWLGIARIAGQAALLLASVLLGGLLALVGQTYQTGADTWELFALWAVLALPWALAGRNAALWLLWAAVLNIAVGLWLGLSPRSWFGAWDTGGLLGGLNLALLAGWERAGSAEPATRWPEFHGRGGPRLLAAAALCGLTVNSLADVFDGGRGELGAATGVWLLAVLALGHAYLRRRIDLAILAMLALSVIAISTCWIGRMFFDGADDAIGAWLLLALLVIAQAAIAAIALRRLAQQEAA